MNVVSGKELRRVNRAGLAKIFGVPVADVDKWIELGCPYVKRSTGKGDAWILDTADVSNWMIDRARRTGRSLLRGR
jgi:phage terminase Nu1 subunit (DNA packaging protein)